MPVTSVVFDKRFHIVSIINPRRPYAVSDLIGQPAWHVATGEQKEFILSKFSACLETGAAQRYRVRVTLPGNESYTVFAVTLERFNLGDQPGIHCVTLAMPTSVDSLSEADEDFLRQLAQMDIKHLAASHGITHQAISKRRARIQEKLGVESQLELMSIANVLWQEEKHGNAL